MSAASSLTEPERDQLLQMLDHFEVTLLGEVANVRRMIAIVRGEPVEDLDGTTRPASGEAPANP